MNVSIGPGFWVVYSIGIVLGAIAIGFLTKKKDFAVLEVVVPCAMLLAMWPFAGVVFLLGCVIVCAAYILCLPVKGLMLFGAWIQKKVEDRQKKKGKKDEEGQKGND